MKLPRSLSILYLTALVTSGVLMVGVGYTTPLEGSLNTIFLCLGLFLFLFGAGQFATLVDSFSNSITNETLQTELSIEQRKLSIYLTILRFLAFRVTTNLKRMYLDFEMHSNTIIVTAFYEVEPSEIDLRLLDDIIIKASARIHNFSLENRFKLMNGLTTNEKHDFTVFAIYD